MLMIARKGSSLFSIPVRIIDLFAPMSTCLCHFDHPCRQLVWLAQSHIVSGMKIYTNDWCHCWYPDKKPASRNVDAFLSGDGNKGP